MQFEQFGENFGVTSYHEGRLMLSANSQNIDGERPESRLSEMNYDVDSSPAQRLFGRRTKTTLPTATSLLSHEPVHPRLDTLQLKHNQQRQARYYNRGAHYLPELMADEVVRMQPFKLGERSWHKARVIDRLDERSYDVQAEDGTIYRRNRAHLKRTKEPSSPSSVVQNDLVIPPELVPVLPAKKSNIEHQIKDHAAIQRNNDYDKSVASSPDPKPAPGSQSVVKSTPERRSSRSMVLPHRKAEEYMRLMDIRSSLSKLGSIRPSGPCKAVMCLDLAASEAGQPIDRNSAINMSGLNKKMYNNAIKSLACLLDLQEKASISDLCVRYSCQEARSLAANILTRYEAEQGVEDSVSYSQVLFNSAAVFTACRHLADKIKINKNKIVDSLGVKKTTFDRLVAQMDETAKKIVASEQKTKKVKRSRNFIEDLEAMAAKEDELSGSKIKKIEEAKQADDDYEEWKKRILENAYKALGKEMPTM